MYSLSSHRFLGLVTRLVYYKASALRQIVEMEQQEKEQGSGAPRNFEAPSDTSKIRQLGPVVEKKAADRTYDDIKKNTEAFELGFIEAGTG